MSSKSKVKQSLRSDLYSMRCLALAQCSLFVFSQVVGFSILPAAAAAANSKQRASNRKRRRERESLFFFLSLFLSLWATLAIVELIASKKLHVNRRAVARVCGTKRASKRTGISLSPKQHKSDPTEKHRKEPRRKLAKNWRQVWLKSDSTLGKLIFLLSSFLLLLFTRLICLPTIICLMANI